MYIHPHICIVYIQSLCIGLCIGLVLTETCLAQWLTLYKPAFFIQGEWFISWHYGTYTNMQMETWCEVEYSIPENKVPVHWTYIYHNRNLLKRSPSLKPRAPIFAAVHAVMLRKKHQRSSAVQEEGLTKTDTIYCYCIIKHMTKKLWKITSCLRI